MLNLASVRVHTLVRETIALPIPRHEGAMGGVLV